MSFYSQNFIKLSLIQKRVWIINITMEDVKYNFFLYGDINNPDAFLDQRCHYAYTPMLNRVEKGEQTGKCCDESRLFLKALRQ